MKLCMCRALPLFFLFTTIFAPLHADKAMAEGGDKRALHNWGANRRVRTQPQGYVGVGGTFDIVEMSLPKNANGEITEESNAVNSKPSFYFGGGGGGVEVDAGMQYEWFQGNTTGATPRGWAAFISVNKLFRNPRIWDGTSYGAWRGTGGTGSSYSMEYKVYNDQEICPTTDQAQPKGSISLELTGKVNNKTTDHLLFFYRQPPTPEYPAKVVKPFLTRPYLDIPVVQELPDKPVFVPPTESSPGAPPNLAWAWPWEGETRTYSTNLHNARQTLFAKRVVCITQDTGRPAENDGSTFTTTFSGGKLTKADGVEAYWNPLARAGDVDHGTNATGYDTPTEGRSAGNISDSNPPQSDHAKDLTWYGFETTSSEYKIQFPKVYFSQAPLANPQEEARKATDRSRTEIYEAANGANGGNIRYTRETVAISLRNAARPLATSIKPASANAAPAQ